MTGITKSYSTILKDKKSMELIVDYNNMAVWLTMMNAKKDVNDNELAAKKVEKATEMKNNKAAKNEEETNRQNEMISGLQAVCRMLGCDNVFVITLRRRW